MHRATRTQVDEDQDLYSLETGLDFAGTTDLARQEFKDEADLNILLKRFGVGGAMQRPLSWGQADYDLDLQRAIGAVEDAKRAHRAMPEELRKIYPTWRDMLNAIESGRLTSAPLDSQKARPGAADQVGQNATPNGPDVKS